jgi:hypothetical protein
MLHQQFYRHFHHRPAHAPIVTGIPLTLLLPCTYRVLTLHLSCSYSYASGCKCSIREVPDVFIRPLASTYVHFPTSIP